MNKISIRSCALAGVALLGAGLTSQASAGCSPSDAPGVQAPPSAPRAPAAAGFTQAAFVQVADFGAGWPWNAAPAIVGLWKVQFLSQGNPGIPDGAVLDDGYATWHADGTELMNSGRPAFSSNFCMGVWKQVGRDTFKLNHFALSWDTSNGTTFVGPTNIRELVTVERGGDRYHGTVVITQYQPDGTTPAGPPIKGTIEASRIEP